jgi:hypothetical protein
MPTAQARPNTPSERISLQPLGRSVVMVTDAPVESGHGV